MSKDHYQDGRKAAIAMINSRAKNGEARADIAKHLFTMADGALNTTEAENQFDAGVRAQLNDLGFIED